MSFLDWLFGSGDTTTTTKVDLPPWYEDAAKGTLKQAMNAGDWYAQPYQGDQYANLNGQQRAAIGAARNNVGSTNAGYRTAMAGTQDVMNYDPSMVKDNFTAKNIEADTVKAGQQYYNYNPRDVNGGSFLNQNVNRYMDPNIKNVEKYALDAIEKSRLGSLNQAADAAIGARAGFGSRQGVMEGVANANAAEAAGQTSANIRSQAYNNATSLMEQDMQRKLQAGLANQSTDLNNAQFKANVGLQNIGNRLNASLANQSAGLQANQFNQQQRLADAQLNQQGQLANQQAGLQGAQLNLNAANQYGNLNSAKQADFLTGLQASLAGGNMLQADKQGNLTQKANQYNSLRQYPVDILNMQLSALNGTQLPTGQSTTTSNPSNPLMSLLGLGMTGASMLPMFGLGGMGMGGFSDKREKTNIQKLGKDPDTGLDIYAYDYKADVEASRKNKTPMPMKRVGPMAQDIEKMHPGATKKVGGKMVVMNLGIGG